MTLLWTFRYYAESGNAFETRSAFESSSKQLKARFRSKLTFLAQLEIRDWREPLFKVLSDQDGLSEIRFVADGLQQGPLGFRSSEFEYTLLFWATEEDNRLRPPWALATAKAWKQACMANRSLSHELWFALQ